MLSQTFTENRAPPMLLKSASRRSERKQNTSTVIVRWQTRLLLDISLQHKGTERCLEKGEDREGPWTRWYHREVLKHLGASSRAVFLKIFNHSWMKQRGQSIPVLKRGKDKKNPHSYRSISLLICVGKLLERMVNRHLCTHLETNNVLSPTQTVYWKLRSTDDQLVYLTQNIEDAFLERKNVVAVFPDLSNKVD